MGVKGCWTCRERKVRCDLQWPTCANCTKARRACKGYGIQLSWPRDGDTKRAIVSREIRSTKGRIQPGTKKFLNSSFWDILLSSELENGRISEAHYLRASKVPRPTYLSPIIMNREKSDLVALFTDSRSLILGPTDEEVLAQFILQVAFSVPSDASNPVLDGVLALSCLQIHDRSKSFRYKRAVLSSVTQSIYSLDEKILLQNLMATMLLYHYELSLQSTSKGDWQVFFCAVKWIIHTSPAMHKLVREEYSVFLHWIYYHEALSEFTVRHWKKPYDGCGFAPRVLLPRASDDNGLQVETSIGCPTDVLQLVVQTCLHALDPEVLEGSDLHFGVEHIKILEHSIRKAIGDYGPIHTQSGPSPDRTAIVADLHRLACLIYVNRAVHRVSGTEFHHKRLVRESILLLNKLQTCQSAWPLFMIACEAVDDDQRLAILDVFERSKQDRRRRSSHIHLIQHLVEGVWNQQDLDMEGQVEYVAILNAVIGGVPFLPAFA